MIEEKAHRHFEPRDYVKVWGVLVLLLVASVVGPMLEIPWLTLITAFGIAVVKTVMVAANFMHLRFEVRMIWFLLIMAFMAVFAFFFGMAPDISKTSGPNWADCMATQSCIEQRY